MYKIQELNQVVCESLKNFTLFNYSAKNLTALGENYGSLILAVELKVRNQHGDENVVNVVAKLLPNNEWSREMFKVHLTFKKELEFYKTIVPTLEEFLKEQGADYSIYFVPKFFGGRVSLNHDVEEVDDDAVLLIENLKFKGFTTVERTKGFDLATAMLILQDLAAFHAIPIALKLKDHERFKAKVLPHIQTVPIFIIPLETQVELRKEQVEMALESGEFDHLSKQIEHGLEIGEYNFGNINKEVREPFATINHNDYWVNNTMIQFENNAPMKNKIVDFQLIDYGSPAKDVLFFLFTSVQAPVLAANYDTLINVYYEKFIQVLSELGCDIEPFNFDAFCKEIDIEAKESQFFHCVVMLKPIFADKENVKEMDQLNEDDLKSDNVSQQHKERQWFIIREFAKRNWI